MLRDRLGLEGAGETLRQIAEKHGVTRERVRQIAHVAIAAIARRWPDLREALARNAGIWVDRHAEPELLGLVARLQLCLFGDRADAESALSPKQTLAKWSRSRLTPLSYGQALRRLGEAMPRVPAAESLDRLLPHALIAPANAEPLIFDASSARDELLHALYETGEGIPFADAIERLGGRPPAFRHMLTVDARFFPDDRENLFAAERRGMRRSAEGWLLALPRDGKAPVEAPLGPFAHLVVGRLLALGVVDAPAWGVRRAADELAASNYAARLPEAASPHQFARIMALHSRGAVRPMRRWRLRWDRPEGPAAALGKHGWVSRVLAVLATPCLYAELRAELRKRYQEYPEYVLQQLAPDGEGEDGEPAAYAVVGQGPQKLFVPRGWKPNAQASNVSPGLRKMLAMLHNTGKLARRLPDGWPAWLAYAAEAAATTRSG